MNYNNYIKEMNSSTPYALHNGCFLTKVSEGKATVEHIVKEYSKDICESLHSGLIFTIADIAARCAASSYGNNTLTAKSSFNHIRPAIGVSKIIASATEVKCKKGFSVFRVNVTDQDDLLLSYGTFVFNSFN